MGAISYGYDAAANRISMTDETGNVTYQYDQLSRLQSEMRQFSGNGVPSGSYSLTYEYNLAGQLKAITDPTGSRVDYGFDSTGRLTSVSGSGANSAPTYASNFAYRAWGAIKDFDFGNGLHQHLNFNSRLQNTSLALSNVNSIGTMMWSYDYYVDGKLSRVTDNAAPNFDRFFDYDHEGRIADALTGNEARGGTTADGPFKQTYGYDVWENTTLHAGRIWTQPIPNGSSNYQSNRHQDWQYDNQGNVMGTYDANFAYDAAGRNNYYSANVYLPNGQSVLEIAQTFDGNSAPASKIETDRSDPNAPAAVTATYYLRSTALDGKVVAELDSSGYKRIGRIYAGGMEIATQTIWNQGAGSQVSWHSTNPATGSRYGSDNGRNVGREEIDPLGADVTVPPDSNPPTIQQHPLYDPRFNDKPLEYSWGPSQEAQDAMDWYEQQLYAAEHYEENLALTARADHLWQSGDRSGAEAIVSNNPNIGVQTADGTTRWGRDAADFLGGLPSNRSTSSYSSRWAANTTGQVAAQRTATFFAETQQEQTATVDLVGGDPIGSAPQESSSVWIRGPFVFQDVYDNFEKYEGKVKTKWCATWVQQVAEKLGQPLGLASNWYGGEQVNRNTPHGTAIMSGLDASGKYPNNDKYNHAGFFLWWLPDNSGFAILENIKGTVQLRYVTGTNGSYFSGVDQYFVIMVGGTVRGGMSGGRRP